MGAVAVWAVPGALGLDRPSHVIQNFLVLEALSVPDIIHNAQGRSHSLTPGVRIKMPKTF